MGFLNKIMFWKKDDFDFEGIANKELLEDPLKTGIDQNPFGDDDPALEPKIGSSPYKPPAELDFTTPQAPGMSAPPNNDFELINSKLDTIKAMLNSMDQRIANMEKGAPKQNKERLW